MPDGKRGRPQSRSLTPDEKNGFRRAIKPLYDRGSITQADIANYELDKESQRYGMLGIEYQLGFMPALRRRAVKWVSDAFVRAPERKLTIDKAFEILCRVQLLLFDRGAPRDVIWSMREEFDWLKPFYDKNVARFGARARALLLPWQIPPLARAIAREVTKHQGSTSERHLSPEKRACRRVEALLRKLAMELVEANAPGKYPTGAALDFSHALAAWAFLEEPPIGRSQEWQLSVAEEAVDAVVAAIRTAWARPVVAGQNDLGT